MVLATKLMKRAKSGEEFSALANEYSMDPGNQNTKGGDLGWFKKGRMVEEFDRAAFSAKKNQIIGPIKSNFGFIINDNFMTIVRCNLSYTYSHRSRTYN